MGGGSIYDEGRVYYDDEGRQENAPPAGYSAPRHHPSHGYRGRGGGQRHRHGEQEAEGAGSGAKVKPRKQALVEEATREVHI